LSVDGSNVELPARKSEALLAVLALRPGVPFGRDKLISMLWPDVPDTQGRTSLRQALGHLRKSLLPDAFVSSADRVHLDPRAVWVDTAELERWSRAAPGEREPLGELWRGPLLDGFAPLEDGFDTWLEGERMRLAERAAVALEECVAALSAAGATSRALETGARLLSIEPARESAHRALMKLHAERGERAAALRQYEQCRALLEREFGVAPSDETQRLQRNVVAADGTQAAPAPQWAPAPPSRRSFADEGRLPLAVIPFEASPGTPEVALLAQALTEDVTTELSRFRQLALISRASLASVLARGSAPEDIAAGTGARMLLGGSVRFHGQGARVTASLVDTTTGLQLWAERWDAPLEDPLAAADRLTRSVVSALALRIDEARLGAARRRPRERLEAYECWLRGLECLRRGAPEADDEARSFFEQALAIAPTFARAHAGISLSHFNDWSCQAWDRWELRERLAFENARRGVELDDADHVTHYILGRIYVYRREFALGERHLEQALALNVNDADFLIHAAVALTQLGQPERAWEFAETALRLNPKHPDWYYPCAAAPLFFTRRLDEAVALALRAPDALVDARAILAAAMAHLGATELATEHAQKFVHQFRLKIARGREPTTAEAVDWLLRVNPLKRDADADFLLDGLIRAGLSSP